MRKGIRASLILIGLMGLGSGPVFAQIIRGERRERQVEVVVVNPPDHPVPTQAQGTTNVAGDVNATVVGTPTVILGNAATNPVMVQNRDEPARQPFQRTGEFRIGDGIVSAFDTFTVPSDKQLVLEYVSISAEILTEGPQIVEYNIQNRGAGNTGRFFLLPQASIRNRFGQTKFISERPVRIYCDAGTDVTIFAVRDRPDALGLGDSVNYVVSGYLVDIP